MRSDGGDTGCPPSHGTGCAESYTLRLVQAVQVFKDGRVDDTLAVAEYQEVLGELRADGMLKQISEKYFGTDVSGP